MGRDWQRYWNSRERVQSPHPLQHVGKTVQGKPVDPGTLDLMVNDIVEALSMESADIVLDLCCGNGLLTHRCAKFCESITGVDFSEPLLDVARREFSGNNVGYVFADVLRLPGELLSSGLSKIYMYEALQHFETADVDRLLRDLRGSSAGDAPIFFGSVPDAERIWNFYDTPARREEYRERTRQGVEPLGHWWRVDELRALAEGNDYVLEVREPDPRLHVAHYRMDALLIPR